MSDLTHEYLPSMAVAEILGITHPAARRLARRGKIPGIKIANRWLIPKGFIEQFARGYEGRRGKPRTKRKYTKRSEIWNKK